MANAITVLLVLTLLFVAKRLKFDPLQVIKLLLELIRLMQTL